MTLSAPTRFNVLTLHPDPLVRAGVASALRKHESFEVFEEDALPAGPDALRIDVVIADYQDALRLADPATRMSRPALAASRVLALTAVDREMEIRRAIEADVNGYVVLGGPLDELIEAVHVLASGGRYVSRRAAQRMMDSLTHSVVTSREQQVLQLLVAGEPNKSIARRLDICLGTVKTHISAILGKLEARSRTEAAAIAVSRGLVAERGPLPRNPSRVSAGMAG